MQAPEGFGCVEPGVYRAVSLCNDDFEFVHELQLHTIMVLTPGEPFPALRQYAEENAINLIHIALEPWQSVADWRVLSRTLVGEAMHHIFDRRNYPILVVDATIFVGLLRKIQHWAFSAILAEYIAYVGPRGNYNAEVFIELVETPVVTADEVTEDTSENTCVLPLRCWWPDWFCSYYDLWGRERKALNLS